MSETQSRLEPGGKEKKFLPVPGIKFRPPANP
jgi:hypothetical protein